MYQFESLDEALVGLLTAIDEDGKECFPRGLRTVELTDVGFTIENPRHRLIWNKPRKWNVFLAVGELFWHLAGKRDVSSVAYFAPKWEQFAQDGIIRSSCYGYKIFRPAGRKVNQWDAVQAMLRADPSTRRAVIDLYDFESDFDPDALDVACACTIQFLLRGGELNMTVYMRSSDAIWGISYDCFIFTMLQELMASQLGCRLGRYTHFSASLHVYEHHVPMMKQIISAPRPEEAGAMPRMPRGVSNACLLQWEQAVRAGTSPSELENVPSYWVDILSLLAIFDARKKGDIKREAKLTEKLKQPLYLPMIVSGSRALNVHTPRLTTTS